MVTQRGASDFDPLGVDDADEFFVFIGPSRTPQELIELIGAHPGGGRANEREGLNRVYEMFWENVEHLLQWINVFESPSSAPLLMHQGGWESPNDIMATYQTELYRLWFNYAASATAVIEHVDEIADNGSPAFRRDYDRIKGIIKKTPVEGVTYGLRNILLHRGWPNFRFRFDLGPEEKHGLYCSPKQLLDSYDRWRPEAKPYLQNLISSGETFSLRDSIEEFAARIQRLYSQIWDAHTDAYEMEWSEWAHLHHEYDSAYQVDERPLSEQLAERDLS